MYELSEPGWFSRVNGIAVVHHPLPSSLMDHAGRFIDHHGIEWHRQDGPGDDIFNTQMDRGFPIATWNVDNAGVIRQYNDFRVADWHGDSVSEYAFGIEHQGFFGTPCTARQLDASAALCAAIVQLAQDAWGEAIPLVKVPRVSVTNFQSVRGFWDHDDVDNGPLNENGHVDKLEGRTWAEQLAKIGSFFKTPRPQPTFHKVLLRPGVDAPDVIVWKRRMSVKGLFRMNSTNDGPHYGAVIEQTTRTFQARKQLVVDGIVGPATWEAAWIS